MKKKKSFLINKIVNCYKNLKLRRIKKIRDKKKKKDSLKDYNYPLW